MRPILASLLLASMTLALVGCGDTASAPPKVTPTGELQGPGVPTEGPEALKTSKTPKR